jgi:hypothetical protein
MAPASSASAANAARHTHVDHGGVAAGGAPCPSRSIAMRFDHEALRSRILPRQPRVTQMLSAVERDLDGLRDQSEHMLGVLCLPGA